MRYTLAEVRGFGDAAARRQLRHRRDALIDMRVAANYDGDHFRKYLKALNPDE